MKILLACLMCLVLTVAQTFAIDGGPDYGGAGVRLQGTYAGVLAVIPTVVDPGPPEVTLTDNSLGLFTLKIPQEGLATGTSAVFRNGIFYSGTITGSADPDSAKLTAIVAASFKEIRAESDTGTSFEPQYDANGFFAKARIVPNPNVFSSASARIRGTASLTYRNSKEPPDPNGESGGPILYKIKGFKQSENS